MVKTTNPKPKTPKEQHATFLSEVEKLRADGVLSREDGDATEIISELLKKKARTVQPEPSLDSESPNGEN